jgi:hypothetical protein
MSSRNDFPGSMNGATMKSTDVLFLIESLERRAREEPEWAEWLLTREVHQIAWLCEEWLHCGLELRQCLAVVRSYLILRQPYAALTRLQATMRRLADNNASEQNMDSLFVSELFGELASNKPLADRMPRGIAPTCANALTRLEGSPRAGK